MAIEELKKKLKEGKTRRERRNAAQALGTIRDKESVPFLIECFKKEDDDSVKTQIINALGDIGSPEAIDFLKKIMDNIEGTYLRLMNFLTLFRVFMDDQSANVNKVVRSAEAATEKLEKLKGEADTSASVTIPVKKLDEITAPLKEDLDDYKKEKDQEIEIFKETFLKDMEEKYPELMHGMPHFKDTLQSFKDLLRSEMRRYDEKLFSMDEKVTIHIKDHKHQESLFWIKVGVFVAIVIPVIISLVSLYYTFNPP